MEQKFQGNPKKQKKYWTLIKKHFNFPELEVVNESLLLFFQDRKNKMEMKISNQINSLDVGFILPYGFDGSSEFKDKFKEELIDNWPKALDKKAAWINSVFHYYQHLTIIDLSNRWERFVKEFAILLGAKIKYNEKYEEIINILKSSFSNIDKTTLFVCMRKIRKVSNKMKHDSRMEYGTDYFEVKMNELINVQKEIFSSLNSFYIEEEWKEYNECLSEEEQELYNKEKEELLSKKEEMSSLNIPYILKWIASLVNSWSRKHISSDTSRLVSIDCGQGRSLTFNAYGVQDENKIINNQDYYCSIKQPFFYELTEKVIT